MSEARSATAPTVLRIVLSKRLRALRTSAHVSLEVAAETIDVTPLTIRRMEKAEVGLKVPYVRILLQSYGADENEIEEFVELTKEANQPGWWHRFRDVLPGWFSVYVSLEDEATLIRTYEPHYVPGLLQTEEYARAVLGAGAPKGDGGAETERRISLRMKRQELLTKTDAPTMWVIMEEAVLHRPIGDDHTMREQIDRLLDASSRQNVTLQILPFSAGAHVGAYGPFHLFRFALPELPDIVYTESLTGAVYQDERADVVAHLKALDRMAGQAATVQETRTLLENARKERI